MTTGFGLGTGFTSGGGTGTGTGTLPADLIRTANTINTAPADTDISQDGKVTTLKTVKELVARNGFPIAEPGVPLIQGNHYLLNGEIVSPTVTFTAADAAELATARADGRLEPPGTNIGQLPVPVVGIQVDAGQDYWLSGKVQRATTTFTPANAADLASAETDGRFASRDQISRGPALTDPNVYLVHILETPNQPPQNWVSSNGSWTQA